MAEFHVLVIIVKARHVVVRRIEEFIQGNTPNTISRMCRFEYNVRVHTTFHGKLGLEIKSKKRERNCKLRAGSSFLLLSPGL